MTPAAALTASSLVTSYYGEHYQKRQCPALFLLLVSIHVRPRNLLKAKTTATRSMNCEHVLNISHVCLSVGMFSHLTINTHLR